MIWTRKRIDALIATPLAGADYTTTEPNSVGPILRLLTYATLSLASFSVKFDLLEDADHLFWFVLIVKDAFSLQTM